MRNAHEAVANDLALAHPACDGELDLVGDGQEHQVGQAHAIDGGDEGDRDAGAQLAGFGQVFHYVDQAHDRAENAERRGIAACRLPYARSLAFVRFEIDDLDVERIAQLGRIGTVDQQLQPGFLERVVRHVDVPFQRQQAVLTRGVGPLDDTANERDGLRLGRTEYPSRHAHALHENRQRVMQQHGSQGAAHHDEEGRRLHEQADMSAFHRLAAQYGSRSQPEPDQAATIHASSFSLARSRAMAWPCSWQIRDSLTPKTSLISRRLSSCS